MKFFRFLLLWTLISSHDFVPPRDKVRGGTVRSQYLQKYSKFLVHGKQFLLLQYFSYYYYFAVSSALLPQTGSPTQINKVQIHQIQSQSFSLQYIHIYSDVVADVCYFQPPLVKYAKRDPRVGRRFRCRTWSPCLEKNSPWVWCSIALVLHGLHGIHS